MIRRFVTTAATGALKTCTAVGSIGLEGTFRAIMELPVGSQGQVSGWIRSIRRHKNVAFAAIGDGLDASSLQLVLNPMQAAR